MSINYTIYLGSSGKRSYQESVEHVQGRAEYIWGRGYADEEVGVNAFLNKIYSGQGNVLFCMGRIGVYYEAKASFDLLLHSDIIAFKQDAYIGAKLRILSSEEPLSWISGYNTSCLFLPIMSDNPDLIHFLINSRNHFLGEYKRKDTYSFFLKNTLLALAGDWSELKIRAETFLNEPNKQKSDEKRIPDHEFYIALCNKDIEGMKIALEKLLEPKLAKNAVYDNNVWFDFYLQMQVLMYAKIAAIHGFDLEIDSPIAPKELIEYKPLKKYEDPYDFMRDFDYSQPLENWISFWKQKADNAKHLENQKGKGFLSRFFGI
ncbi:immunity 49 family protein [Mannheimia massilioguelmaensis]|uniref:immunity 49 family protein n=1 Tax=Mannheimia massilioguelmaensis TaxID=1604354 RepID=UPI0005CB3FFB|nr:immunity 49 family protein [Mannheimia massilioguelmaensis]